MFICISTAGLLIIRGKKSQISLDFWRQIRGENGRFRGNFQGKFRRKTKRKAKKIIPEKRDILDRASDNSREKKSNFAGFLDTNSRRKLPISQEFLGNFRGKLRQKTKKKAKKKDSRKKRYIGRMSNSGQERKHKSSSNTVLKAIVLVSSYKKNISFTETPSRLTSIFSCNLEPNTATQ